ncbi:MAG: hypothetical protein R3C49_07345 [Planctomycetaceae bacterium]
MSRRHDKTIRDLRQQVKVPGGNAEDFLAMLEPLAGGAEVGLFWRLVVPLNAAYNGGISESGFLPSISQQGCV